MAKNVTNYPKYATTVVGAHSVPDWYEALDRLVAVGQLADEARRQRPGLQVLFTTGYTRNAIVHHGRLDPGVEMIGKPFSFEELGLKIRALLDRHVTEA